MARSPSPWELVGGDTSWVLLAFGRMATLDAHLYCTFVPPSLHLHHGCQWGNLVVTHYSSTNSKSSHRMRNVGSIREQSNTSSLIFNEVHCALHGRTKHHAMVAAISDATLDRGYSS